MAVDWRHCIGDRDIYSYAARLEGEEVRSKRQETNKSRQYAVGSRQKTLLIVYLLLTAYSLLLTPDVSAVTIDEKYKPLYEKVSDKFMCLCGCGSTIKTCPMEKCGFAVPFKEEMVGRIQMGETEEQIINYFVGKHGQQILSAPTKKGFNLIAWITPFAAIIIVGFLIKKVINKWTVGQRSEVRSQKPALSEVEGSEIDDKYRKVLNKELEELE
jgi:cytochrome c-type biogenesis protein CcmH